MQDTKLIEELKRENYEVGFSEQYVTCGFGLFKILNIPSTFWLSATAIYRIQTKALGVQYFLSYVPGMIILFNIISKRYKIFRVVFTFFNIYEIYG